MCPKCSLDLTNSLPFTSSCLSGDSQRPWEEQEQQELSLHCPIAVPSLSLHCPIAVPSLSLHCPIALPSLSHRSRGCPVPAEPWLGCAGSPKSQLQPHRDGQSRFLTDLHGKGPTGGF